MTVIFKSAVGATMMALLPPSSKILLPKRRPTIAATSRPMRIDPVADTSATRLSLVINSPSSLPPVTMVLNPFGKPNSSLTSFQICWQATAHNGTFSLAFQIQALPQTQATVAFQAHTATGKLNAEIIPTTPKGCHCSIMKWSGRSLLIVKPVNCLDRPTA